MTDELLVTINPTGERLAALPVAGPAEVEAAVAAARAAQPAWAALAGAERARILRRAAEILRARNDQLAVLETRDTGKPIEETRVDAISGAECLEYFAALAQSASGEHIDLGPAAFGYTRREALGITAGIGCELSAADRVLEVGARARLRQCDDLQAASLTPLTAVELARAFRRGGTCQTGSFRSCRAIPTPDAELTRHPEIRKVSLTGSVGTGKAVMNDASGTIKAVTLELGGKSPILVFDDAKLDHAVAGALLGNFYSAGEVCSNGTRVFVHRKVKDAFLGKLAGRVGAMKIGDPMDPATRSRLAHIRRAHGNGPRLHRARPRGRRANPGGRQAPHRGHARQGLLRRADRLRRLPGRDEHRARGDLRPRDVRTRLRRRGRGDRARNATEFGLSAGGFTNDLNRAHRVIARLEAGTCWINHYNVTPIELPFGGVKLSGLGRENGRAAMEHYTQLKSVYVAKGDIDAPY